MEAAGNLCCCAFNPAVNVCAWCVLCVQDKGELQLLHNISGTFRPGVLTALMGVSGEWLAQHHPVARLKPSRTLQVCIRAVACLQSCRCVLAASLLLWFCSGLDPQMLTATFTLAFRLYRCWQDHVDGRAGLPQDSRTHGGTSLGECALCAASAATEAPVSTRGS